MFTGLIEDTGWIRSISKWPEGRPHPQAAWSSSYDLEIQPNNQGPVQEATILNCDTKIGDSISIDGTCLTVTSLQSHHSPSPSQARTFTVGLSPETLRVTNLGNLKVGDHVNLERALSLQSRLGGHFVQGHVDTTARIVKVDPDKDSKRFTFRFEHTIPSESKADASEDMRSKWISYLTPKGYVTIDGISLTINSINHVDNSFSINLIPHSQSKVTLTHKLCGELVNIEFDVLVKTAVNVLIDQIHQSSILESKILSIVNEVISRKGQLG